MEEIKFRISEAAKRVGVHWCTLRDLEKRGLIHPARSLSGHRLYSEQDLALIRAHYEKKKKSWMTNWGTE